MIWNEITKSEIPDRVLLEKLRNVIQLRLDSSLFINNDFRNVLKLGLSNINNLQVHHIVFRPTHENGPRRGRVSAAEGEKSDCTDGAVRFHCRI